MRSYWLGVVLLGLSWGCEGKPADAPTARQQSSQKSLAPPREVEETQADFTGRPDPAVLGQLSAEARARVKVSPLPVLVLSSQPWVGRQIVMTGTSWVAVSARGDALTVSLHGSNRAYKYPGIPPREGAETVRGQKAFITNNEQIWSVSWTERGVAWSLDVECDDPQEARCASGAAARSLAEQLVYVGGRAAPEEP